MKKGPVGPSPAQNIRTVIIDSAADQNTNNNENNTENLIISSSENLNSENQTDNIFKNVRKNLVNENVSNTDQLPLSAKNNNNRSGDIINNDNTIEIDIKPLLKLIDNISFMQTPESPLILMPNYDKNDNFLEIRFVNSLQYISVDFYVIEYAVDGNQDDFFKEETKDNFVRISTLKRHKIGFRVQAVNSMGYSDFSQINYWHRPPQPIKFTFDLMSANAKLYIDIDNNCVFFPDQSVMASTQGSNHNVIVNNNKDQSSNSVATNNNPTKWREHIHF